MSSDNNNGFLGNSFGALLCKHVGKTVTIFTKSGGQSGCGFTGVVLSVNDCFVRLITRIGPAPGCALGNSCSYGGAACDGYVDGYHVHGKGSLKGFGYGGGGKGPQAAGGYDGYPIYNVGSVTDIPIDSIASFVHNAV
jgi:hypothetical protein